MAKLISGLVISCLGLALVGCGSGTADEAQGKPLSNEQMSNSGISEGTAPQMGGNDAPGQGGAQAPAAGTNAAPTDL